VLIFIEHGPASPSIVLKARGRSREALVGPRRPQKLMRRDDKHRPVWVKALKRAWRKIEWREGVAEPLRSRFVRLRVRAAHRDEWRAEPRPENRVA
jgi:SRSO17 transposase